MAVAVHTTGKGPPIVLVHGLGSDHTVWDHCVEPLAAKRTVATLDLPGFGASDPPPSGFNLAEVADWVTEAVTERIETPFELVGASLGGATALTLADRHQDLVSRLVLQAPAGFRPSGALLSEIAGLAVGPVFRVRHELGSRLAGSALARRALLVPSIAEPETMEPEDAQRMFQANRTARSVGPALKAAMRADLLETLRGLTVPVGVIWGTRDDLIPADTVDRIREVRPDIPVELIEGGGHIPQLEHPERFMGTLERTLDRLA